MKLTNFPMEYKGVFIHKYDANDENLKGDFFAIGFYFSEVYIDEEEASSRGMSTIDYQNLLKSCGAKQYHHKFIYGENDEKDVQDSYFKNLEDCKKAIDSLTAPLNVDFRIPFDNGFIVPVYSNLNNDTLSVHCVFIEYELAEDILIVFETKYINGNTIQEIIINAIEKDAYEVR